MRTDNIKIFIIILAVICLYGCGKKQSTVDNPCANVYPSCYGNKGEYPYNDIQCNRMAECFDWEMIPR